MSLYLDRQPLEKCPDGHERTGVPEEWSAAQQAERDGEYSDAYTRHCNAVRELVIATLAGNWPACLVLHENRLQPLTGAEIAAVLIEGKDAMTDLAKLFASPMSPDAKTESWVWATDLIDALVGRTAARLAKIEIGEEA